MQVRRKHKYNCSSTCLLYDFFLFFTVISVAVPRFAVSGLPGLYRWLPNKGGHAGRSARAGPGSICNEGLVRMPVSFPTETVKVTCPTADKTTLNSVIIPPNPPRPAARHSFLLPFLVASSQELDYGSVCGFNVPALCLLKIAFHVFNRFHKINSKPSLACTYIGKAWNHF